MLSPSILVITSIRDNLWGEVATEFCKKLCFELRERHGLGLASTEPLTLEAALRFAQQGKPYLIVLVSEVEELPSTLRRLEDIKSPIDPITVAFQSGTARLKLSNASMADIVELVRLAAAQVSRNVFDHRVAAESNNIVSLQTVAARAHSEPQVIQEPKGDAEPPPIDRKVVLGTVQTSLEWVEAATKSLTHLIFSDGEQPAGIYGRSWEDILASFARLAGLRDAPAEIPTEYFGHVERMLRHEAAADSPLVKTAKLLSYDPFAIKLLLIILAPELDIRFQRYYGILNDDMGRRHATLGLAAAIIAASTERETPQSVRAKFASLDQLRALRLIDGFGDCIANCDEPVRIDSQYLDWFVTGRPELLMASETHRPFKLQSAPKPGIAVPHSWAKAISEGVNDAPARGHILALTGSGPDWVELAVEALADQSTLFVRPLEDAPASGAATTAFESVRLAALLGKRLAVDMSGDPDWSKAFCRELNQLFAQFPKPAILMTSEPSKLSGWLPDIKLRICDLPAVGKADEVAALFAAMHAADVQDAHGLSRNIASKLTVPITRLSDLPHLAMREAARQSARIDSDAVWMRALASLQCTELPQLAQRIEPRPAPSPKDPDAKPETPLDRVVLPLRQQEQLKTIIQHVNMSRKVLREWKFAEQFDATGVAALFAGESGTGKTSAAHAVASTLNADLYVIDLARIVSKYIGETEKNLDIAFNEAQRAGAVLLFDEADALFGKRSKVSDAHDRYANIEVAYLLQRIEKFDGLAILTTNHERNIDPAFGRRLRFTVQFPFPEVGNRLKIWERALPVGSPHRHRDVDFTLAARRLEINGGSIRQIMLHALMTAAEQSGGLVAPGHLRSAAREELGRLARYDTLKLVDTLFGSPAQAEAA